MLHPKSEVRANPFGFFCLFSRIHTLLHPQTTKDREEKGTLCIAKLSLSHASSSPLSGLVWSGLSPTIHTFLSLSTSFVVHIFQNSEPLWNTNKFWLVLKLKEVKKMFDKIKNSTKYVIENSKYVSINYSKLDKFIKNIDCTNLKNWLLYNPYNLLELNIEKIINFLLLLFLLYHFV